MKKETDVIFGMIRPKIAALLECTSGKYPLLSSCRLTDDICVSIIPGRQEKDTGDGYSVWLLDISSNAADVYKIWAGDPIHCENRYAISKYRGKEYAADAFTKLIIQRLAEAVKAKDGEEP